MAGGESVESFPLGRRQRAVKNVEGRADCIAVFAGW